MFPFIITLCLTVFGVTAGCSLLLARRGMLILRPLPLVTLLTPILILLMAFLEIVIKRPSESFVYEDLTLVLFYLTIPYFSVYLYQLVTRLSEKTTMIYRFLCQAGTGIFGMTLFGLTITNNLSVKHFLLGIVVLCFSSIIGQQKRQQTRRLHPLLFITLSLLSMLLLFFNISQHLFMKIALYIGVWVLPFLYTHIRLKKHGAIELYSIPLQWLFLLGLEYVFPEFLGLYSNSFLALCLLLLSNKKSILNLDQRVWWIFSLCLPLLFLIASGFGVENIRIAQWLLLVTVCGIVSFQIWVSLWWRNLSERDFFYLNSSCIMTCLLMDSWIRSAYQEISVYLVLMSSLLIFYIFDRYFKRWQRGISYSLVLIMIATLRTIYLGYSRLLTTVVIYTFAIYFSNKIIDYLLKRKGYIKGIKVLIATIFIMLFFTELMLKNVSKTHLTYREYNYIEPYRSYYMENDIVVHSKSKKSLQKTREFRYVYEYNEVGIIDKPLSYISDDSYKILVVGDSFTQGNGANQESSWPRQLEQLLHKNSSKSITVINAGIAGSDPMWQFKFVKKKLLNIYKPKEVIICIGPSDIDELMVRSGRLYKELPLILKRPLIDYFYGWSYIFRWITHEIMGYNTMFLQDEVYNKKIPIVNKIIYSIIVDKFAPLAKTHNFKLSVIFYLNTNDIFTKLIDRLYSETSFHILDLHKEYKKNLSAKQIETLYWPIDGHHNKNGYKLWAEIVAPLIKLR